MTHRRVGAYIYWTKPRITDTKFFSSLDQAVLTASAIMWQKLNGSAWLFTDRRGHEELEELGLLSLWDHIDVTSLESISTEINPSAFWDIGKTFILNQLPTDACILDLDLIIWEKLKIETPNEVAFLHWEAPVAPWYLLSEKLSTPDRYKFPSHLDWDAPVCNTAFICCPDRQIRQAFFDAAFEFAKGNRPNGSGIAEMLFSGQRLLSHTISVQNALPHPLVDYLYVPLGESHWLTPSFYADDPLTPYAFQSGIPFTHLWQHKHILRNDPVQASAFCDLITRQCVSYAADIAEKWLGTLNPFKEK